MYVTSWMISWFCIFKVLRFNLVWPQKYQWYLCGIFTFIYYNEIYYNNTLVIHRNNVPFSKFKILSITVQLYSRIIKTRKSFRHTRYHNIIILKVKNHQDFYKVTKWNVVVNNQEAQINWWSEIQEYERNQFLDSFR